MSNKMDFSNYKFRCSGLKNLMVKPRKKEKDAGLPSVTTQSYLQELWIKEVYGREKIVSSPAMEKGTAVESHSMELVEKVTGKTFFKNSKQLENEYITGTPDIVDKPNKMIHDIKSSWDLWTFVKVTEDSAKSDYYWQLVGYMWLGEANRASLKYALVNTPEHIMAAEYAKLAWIMGEEEAETLVRKNHTFDDIPEAERLKEFWFDLGANDIYDLIDAIVVARNYMNGLSL